MDIRTATTQGPGPRAAPGLLLRRPVPEDGPALHDLVAACPPLDPNSRYCNLLQVSHFAATAVVAEDAAGRLRGSVTGYLRPDAPDTWFVWQVAVAAPVRGQGLAARMFDAVLARAECAHVRWLETTVTPDNAASLAAFRRFARRHGARLVERPGFEREPHFAGRHEDEVLLRIGPFDRGAPAAAPGADRPAR